MSRRVLRSDRLVTSAVASADSQRTADVYTTSPLLTFQPDESRLRRKGSSDQSSAQQGRTDLWGEDETKELKRLVNSNIDSQGKVSWKNVESAWRSQNLRNRTKASLMAKWRDMNKKSATAMIRTEPRISTPPISVTTDTSVSAHAVDRSNTIRKKDQLLDNNTTTVDVAAAKAIKHAFGENLKKSRMIGCRPNTRKAPYRVSGRTLKPIINEVDRLISLELSKSKDRPSWNELSILVYAGALTVSELVNHKTSEKIKRSKNWFKHSHEEVCILRVTIGKATAELQRRKHLNHEKLTDRQASNIRMLRRKYEAKTYVEIASLVERLKNRLQLLRSRIELREADERRARVRRMPTKMILHDTGKKEKEQTPNVNNIRGFWEKIVGEEKSFNSEDRDLLAWKQSLTLQSEEDDLKKRLTRELWDGVVRKAKPWKAHGPDGIQGYWWKAFKTAGEVLYQLTRDHLTTGTPLPLGWLTEGRVVLIYKAGSTDDPANYRPIACLNTCYKMITGFITAYLNIYVKERHVLPGEQIALREGVWGCTHALTLDQTLTADAQDQKQRAISVAWIDYAKAFDSVPHSYIKWLIGALQVPKPLRKFLNSLLNSWRVRYEARTPRGRTIRSNYLRIRSGVLQGDSFSPLLFCIAMAPISHAINSKKCGYTTASGKFTHTQLTLSHLLYMDDLKLYGSSAKDLTKLLKVVESISTAINMKMNTKKCAVAHFIPKRLLQNQVGKGNTASIDEVLGFPTVDEGALYKYLGMEQSIGMKETEAWKRVEERCCKTVKLIWNSDLTYRQKVNAYNSTVIPALTYVVGSVIKGSGTYASVLERGKKFDVKVRKILVQLKARYKASCVERLYLSTELGGCGLKSVRDSIMEATIYTWAYLCTKPQLRNSLGLFVGMDKRSKRSVISDAKKVLGKHNIIADLEPASSIVNINGVRYSDARTLARHVVELMRTGRNISRHNSWGAKVMAGRVLKEPAIDVSTCFTWLKEGKLSSIAVRNVLAAQEGCLITKTHPSCKSIGNISCRACGNPKETIEHVTTSCSTWLSTLYIDRHDSVGRSLHYRICEKYGLAPPHYSQRVESVMENERIKLYWDQPVQTKKLIKHHKPDIIIFDKSSKTATILEVAVSWFTGIGKQIEIKTNRYCVNGNWEDKLNPPYPPGDNLQRELQSTGWRVIFLPVVIGACGEVVPGLSDQISQVLGIGKRKAEDCVERMQRSACLGTSRSIKNHLARTG